MDDHNELKLYFTNNEAATQSMRHSSDILQEEYCKLINSINTERKK